MSKGVILTPDFLDQDDVMPVEGDRTDYTKPSVFDIPTAVDVTGGSADEVVLHFVYPDREVPGDETALEGDPGIRVKRGRYSGKLMTLRLGKTGLPTLSERLRDRARFQKRKNQELNFLLLSNILRKKQLEIQAI